MSVKYIFILIYFNLIFLYAIDKRCIKMFLELNHDESYNSQINSFYINLDKELDDLDDIKYLTKDYNLMLIYDRVITFLALLTRQEDLSFDTVKNLIRFNNVLTKDAFFVKNKKDIINAVNSNLKDYFDIKNGFDSTKINSRDVKLLVGIHLERFFQSTFKEFINKDKTDYVDHKKILFHDLSFPIVNKDLFNSVNLVQYWSPGDNYSEYVNLKNLDISFVGGFFDLCLKMFILRYLAYLNTLNVKTNKFTPIRINFLTDFIYLPRKGKHNYTKLNEYLLELFSYNFLNKKIDTIKELIEYNNKSNFINSNDFNQFMQNFLAKYFERQIQINNIEIKQDVNVNYIALRCYSYFYINDVKQDFIVSFIFY